MNESKSLRITALILMFFPALFILLRIESNGGFDQLGPDHKYKISYLFDLEADAAYSVKTFLPVNNQRQQVKLGNSTGSSSVYLDQNNKALQWKGEANSTRLTIDFEFEGQGLNYAIDTELPYTPDFSEEMLQYVSPTEYIQSKDERIEQLAVELSSGKNSLSEILTSYYDFVYQMPSSGTSELTDALTALELGEASCNGKSRLLAALCRNMRIPTRLVGGLILEEATKKTSHAWVEINIEGTWVPFDALNGYFASIPAHYLELYHGDHFLITRTKDITFDYNYKIEKKRAHAYPKLALLNIWELMDDAKIPEDMFRMILLLPFGAFLVAIFKNVIGIKTYGVFLPVLISLSLLETGLVPGLLLFSLMIGVVALVNFPLEKWGIQYNAKISSMLIAVVITALLAIKLLHATGWLVASAPLFFPIIILTIVSERVARKIEEEGLRSSLELYGTTLIVTVLIYLVLSSQTIQYFVITFPEIILSIAGINLMLGKWIGLRVMEYYRFLQVSKS